MKVIRYDEDFQPDLKVRWRQWEAEGPAREAEKQRMAAARLALRQSKRKREAEQTNDSSSEPEWDQIVMSRKRIKQGRR